MAPDLTVEIKHAVYDTYSHQAGAELTVDPTRLETLLSQGDAALNRGQGMFFETIDNRLVIVFSGNRSEKTKGQMRYFDVFSLSADSIGRVDLEELINGLYEYSVPEYGVEPDPRLTVTLPQEPVQHDPHPADSSRSPQGQHNPTEPEVSTGDSPSNQEDHRPPSRSAVDERFIAEIWEQIRRDTIQCQATLDEVTKFFESVDGALQETSFVSQCREGVEYFDISGEQELAMKTNPQRIVEYVTELVAGGDLTYDALPTYREELEQKRERERHTVRNDEQLSETAKVVIWEFYNNLDSRIEEYPKLAAKLMQEVEDETLPQEEEEGGGIASRFSGLMGGGDDQTVTELIDPTDYPHIDDEIIAKVDAELDEERERIKQDIEDQLMNDLRNELLHQLNQHARRVADDAMTAIEDTRTSELQERAKDPETEY